MYSSNEDYQEYCAVRKGDFDCKFYMSDIARKIAIDDRFNFSMRRNAERYKQFMEGGEEVGT